jgi:hypothetical protein
VVAGGVIADLAAVHCRAFLDDNQRRTPSIGTGAPREKRTADAHPTHVG